MGMLLHRRGATTANKNITKAENVAPVEKSTEEKPVAEKKKSTKKKSE